MLSRCMSDHSGVATGWVKSHGRDYGLDSRRRDKRHQLAFVSDKERVEPENFASAFYILAHQQGRRVDLDPDLRGCSNFAQRSSQTAPRRIAQSMNFIGIKHDLN